MSEHIKTEKKIIEDGFLKTRTFGFHDDKQKDIQQIIFNEDKRLKKKWVSLSWLQSLPPNRTVCVLLDELKIR